MSERMAKWLILGLTAALVILGVVDARAQGAGFPVPSNQVAIAGTVATATRIVTAPSGKQIVVTSLTLVPVATSVVTFTYGTGTNCGTGNTALTGAMTFAAGQTINVGGGSGPILILPSGNDLCITIATAAAPGSLVYTVFP